jgi:diaminohydroxyphosphoribosylaminopyrimidine deaminase/5-amino-6-(5-phosphoribosylamino)uracil reductase
MLSLADLLVELSRREIDSVLVEGGGAVLSAFLSAGLADEVYAFVAPKILNDAEALSPFIGGASRPMISDASRLSSVSVREVDGDALIHGYLSEL